MVHVPSAPTHCDWFSLQTCGEDLPFTSCFQNDALHSYCGLDSRPVREESRVLAAQPWIHLQAAPAMLLSASFLASSSVFLSLVLDS